MKKQLLLLCAVLILGQSAKAAVGDTTWVQANVDSLSWYGNYDSAVTFPAPGTSYRRIYMIFTLSRYVCPGTPQYCGDWDYTVLNYLMTPGGDTMELGRLITPYASFSAPRTTTTWQQHYVFDVTDYAALLHGPATMRILYSGYSGGFMGNIKFAFIEGTPDRDVVAIKRLWHGSYDYGSPTNINTHFPAIAETAPTGTVSAALKFLVTGHGSDTLNGCCEFMSHNYQVKVNAATVSTETMWRADCGSNQLWPQSGSWVFERANWCPGSLVDPHVTTLTGISAGSNYNLGVVFDPYTATPSHYGWGSYTTEGAVIYYKGMNKTLDITLEQIIAPTSDENHFRENPISHSPIVHVKNTGSTTITGLRISSTIDGGTPFNYDWVGSLASMQETDITINGYTDVATVSGTSGNHTYVAKVTMVNGATGDDDTSNNKMISSFIGAPKWPASFKVTLRTNNETNGSGKSETTWKIFNESGAVVASRLVSNINTTYTDTVTLPPASYRLLVEDGSCDGLAWWYHNAANDGVNAGYINIRNMAGTLITMNGYTYGGTYNNDFGCSFSQYFTTMDPSAVNDIAATGISLEAYPNPAQNTVNVAISGMQQVGGRIRIIDVLGRVVSESACIDVLTQVGVTSLQNGVYTLIYIDDKQPNNKLTARLLIAR